MSKKSFIVAIIMVLSLAVFASAQKKAVKSAKRSKATKSTKRKSTKRYANMEVSHIRSGNEVAIETMEKTKTKKNARSAAPKGNKTKRARSTSKSQPVSKSKIAPPKRKVRPVREDNTDIILNIKPKQP